MQIFTDIFCSDKSIIAGKVSVFAKSPAQPRLLVGRTEETPVLLSPQLPGPWRALSLPSVGHLGPSEVPHRALRQAPLVRNHSGVDVIRRALLPCTLKDLEHGKDHLRGLIYKPRCS